MLLKRHHLAKFAARPWVASNAPAKCEVDRMNGSQDMRRTDRQTDTHTHIHTHTHRLLALRSERACSE